MKSIGALNSFYATGHNVVVSDKKENTEQKKERIQEYRDPESGAVVKNHYHHNS